MDAFPQHVSTTLVPVNLPEKPEAMEYVARHGGVKAFIIYQEPKNMRVFSEFLDGQWPSKGKYLDNFKRTLLESKQENFFEPDAIHWEKISKGLLRNPDRKLKNADKRLGFLYQNVFIVKRYFTFGHRHVEEGHLHFIQTSQVPMLLYELPESSFRCRAQPNLYRRSMEPYDQMLYHRYVLEPHTSYPIPAKTRYILMTVQKTVFAFDILPETILPDLTAHGFALGDFRKVKSYGQKVYSVPPPTPAHQPVEMKKSINITPLKRRSFFEAPMRPKKMKISAPFTKYYPKPTLTLSSRVHPKVPAPETMDPVAEPIFVLKPNTVFAQPQVVTIATPEKIPAQPVIPETRVSQPVTLPAQPMYRVPETMPAQPMDRVPETIVSQPETLPAPPVIPETLSSAPPVIPETLSSAPQINMESETIASQPVMPAQQMDIVVPETLPAEQIDIFRPEHFTLPIETDGPIPTAEQLEPSLQMDLSFEQLMSAVFNEPLPAGEPPVVQTVPPIFPDNDELLSFLNDFEQQLTAEDQPMDLSMPKTMDFECNNSIGFRPITPMNLCING